MEGDQENERFDTENDFEGGQYIGGEFFYGAKREKRQQTADDRLYGIFAEDSGSDDDRRARKREKTDYTQPVAFVSKGAAAQQPADPAQMQQSKDQQGLGHKADEEDEDTGRPSFATMRPAGTLPGDAPGQGQGTRGGIGVGGLGYSQAAGRGSGGIGFTQGLGPGDRGADEDDEEAVLPTAFGARIKARAAQRRQQEAKQVKQEKQREVNKSDPSFANFEKHTKGIGLKLLEKMGYKAGEGLGRDQKGIVKPVEAKMRQKNMGMGFGQRQDDEGRREPSPPKGGAKDMVAAAPTKLWKKRHAETRVKREYKTASEVLETTGARPLGAQPILDLRGPQARLITNMEHLNMPVHSEQGSVVPMPELQHNLQLLVDLAEADIQKLDAKLRHEQDSATLLGREKSRLEEEALGQEAQLERLATVLQLVAQCAEKADTAAPTTLKEVEVVYTRLYQEYREEYVLYNLASAALAAALPRMLALLRGWAPLAEPSRGVRELRRLRTLLDPQDTTSGGGDIFPTGDLGGAAPYELLVAEAVLPPLRFAAVSWEPRDPEPLLAWLEEWEGLLPRTTMAHVMDMLVMPALRRAVTGWEPRQETVPIHAWLHPWLPYLGPALEELYPVIRHKLAVALMDWHPSDSSALLLLRPWHRVFSIGDWEALITRSITSKLGEALAGLVINPAAQDMSAFHWVMAWADVLPPQHMASLLEMGFFPKWHQVLHYWLSHTPNYDEVTRWYLGWKSAFPANLLDQERVRRQFNAALDMMNTAVDGAVPPLAPQGAYASRWAGAQDEEAAPEPAKGPVGAMPTGADLTLKDLVQRFASEHGINFMPKFGRMQDGMQVYSFGSTSVILDNMKTSIRAMLNGRWAPVTLEALLQSNVK